MKNAKGKVLARDVNPCLGFTVIFASTVVEVLAEEIKVEEEERGMSEVEEK